MAALNQCNFIGNTADAPEVRVFDGGGKIATIRIAITERYVDRSGTQKENTEWVSIVFNGKLADVAEKYIVKGSSVFVSGKLHTRSWQDQQGGKHYSTEVNALTLQLLDKRDAQPQAQPQAPAQPAYHRQAPAQQAPIAPPQYQQPAPAPQYAPPAQPQPQYGPQPGYAPQYGQQEGPDLPFS